jgi:hypothetical protein
MCAGRNAGWCEAKWLVWFGASMLWCFPRAGERIEEQMACMFLKNHFGGQQKIRDSATLVLCPLWRNLFVYAPMANPEYVATRPRLDRLLHIWYEAFSMAIGVVSPVLSSKLAR